MSLQAIMDAIAVKAATMTGIKAAYSATGGGQGTTARLYPMAVDDGPVIFIWPAGGDLDAGNDESFVHYIEGHIWARNPPGAAPITDLVPFVERFRVGFRTYVDANGTAVLVLMTGYRAPEPATSDGQPFLVMTVTFRAVEKHHSSDYTLTP